MTFDTLGQLLDGGHELWVYCEQSDIDGQRCNHKGIVNLEALAAQLGRDHRCMHEDLFGKFRCTMCGSTLTSFRHHPPTNKQGANPYARNANGW